MRTRRLIDFPYVLAAALRRLQARGLLQARLAVKYGAEILLIGWFDCEAIGRRPWPRGTCGARFEDLPPRRPPDLPGVLMRFRVLKGGRD